MYAFVLLFGFTREFVSPVGALIQSNRSSIPTVLTVVNAAMIATIVLTTILIAVTVTVTVEEDTDTEITTTTPMPVGE